MPDVMVVHTIASCNFQRGFEFPAWLLVGYLLRVALEFVVDNIY